MTQSQSSTAAIQQIAELFISELSSSNQRSGFKVVFCICDTAYERGSLIYHHPFLVNREIVPNLLFSSY